MPDLVASMTDDLDVGLFPPEQLVEEPFSHLSNEDSDPPELAVWLGRYSVVHGFHSGTRIPATPQVRQAPRASQRPLLA